MPDHPKTLLIILNHNSLQKLGTDTTKFLQSILSTDYPNLNIVIIDNASTDHSDTLISTEVEKNGKGKLVKLETNMGYAGGNNYGFRNFGHDSKYVVFLNNDVEVEPDWLTKIIDLMEKDETIAAAQPKILQIKDRKRIDSLGGIVDELGRAYDIGHGMINRIDVSQPYQVFYARGAAIVIRKKVFQKLGGFDEDYFIYYEETDFCWRARLLGYKIVTVPTSVIYHLGGGTMGKPNPRSIYLSRKNQLTTLIKNYETANMVKHVTELLLRYILYALATLIKTRDIKIPAAIFTAIIWNLKNLGKTLKKRKQIQTMRKVSDNEIKKYMLTKKRYEELTSYLSRAY